MSIRRLTSSSKRPSVVAQPYVPSAKMMERLTQELAPGGAGN
jgi:hypothetical protein